MLHTEFVCACWAVPVLGGPQGLFVNDPYRIEAGHGTVTDAPGWGVKINLDWLARARHHETERT